MGRPSSPITTEAARALQAIEAYMVANSATRADLAKRAHISPSTVGRVLDAQPARAFPALLKLHKYVINADAKIAPAQDEGVLGALERGNAMATAQILRAIADLLDRRHPRP